jgi:hypothetical protein
MAAKKSAKRKASKSPTTITGKDAFILSFVARNGGLSPEQHRDVEKYLSPQVHVAISTPKTKRKQKGQKTLFQLRRLAESNSYHSPDEPRGTRKRLGLFRKKSTAMR